MMERVVIIKGLSLDEREPEIEEKAHACLIKYEKECKHLGNRFDQVFTSLMVCHYNSIPLDFDRLLSFEDFSLAHDILGIDRYTGKMTNHFRPRCAL
ncbi:DUF6874 family protein [Entomobacter blattae]|uniref:DUF6874 domain-containing protein n=1 Tax=Entomobacter blattae TaxID=2762277 RepID=A0A7H1NTT9_9PROT|nr:hypothetical protein [Entomobacter blattae]QNT79199.1 hypothetical protein JGUZn3_19940 [Entomobacter blattae]